MTDKSAFTDAEWHALADAPLLVTMAVFAAGEHGPISMVKEAAASARLLAQPGDREPATELIAAMSHDAQGHEARHDAKQHRGKSLDQTVDEAITQLGGAAAALGRIPLEEAIEVRSWLVDIARAVADAAKGVTEREQAVIDRIRIALGGIASEATDTPGASGATGN